MYSLSGRIRYRNESRRGRDQSTGEPGARSHDQFYAGLNHPGPYARERCVRRLRRALRSERRRDVPSIAVRIDHARSPVAIRLIRRWVDRGRPGIHRAPIHFIHVRHV